MKTLSSESPKQRTRTKVTKPQMEKRRRERINHSLEALRLLMLEHTHNENMKNPKVEKAEILESVVHFLKTEKKDVDKGHLAGKKTQSMDQRPSCSREDSYREGMRSCLLRVSHFIANKSQEFKETSGDAIQASVALPEPQTHPSPPVPTHRALMPAPVGKSAALSPQNLIHHNHQNRISHPYLTQMPGLHRDARGLFPSTSAASMPLCDPVWRPWPL